MCAAPSYDPALSGVHAYLGAVDDLEGGSRLLYEDQQYHLPLLMLEGVVLVPGAAWPRCLV
jgi:hypothetical protein